MVISNQLSEKAVFSSQLSFLRALKDPAIPGLCKSYGFRQYLQADTNTGFAAAGVNREDR